MKRVIKYIVSIIAILALLAGIIGLNVAIQNNNASRNKAASQRSTRLNVAMVNEDKAVTSGDKQYNLGNSYIKSLEKDDSQNWSVVSRGTATKGLADGDYQLVVIIPSDFSAKVLDMNSLSAERAVVSYEVNAHGNQQLETEANKVGKDIVTSLNNQLVDMYMASILSNLYAAQQNVQTLANQSATNIGSYRSSLLDAAKNFNSNLPSLLQESAGSLGANDNLIQSLNSFGSLYDGLDDSQQSFDKDLTALVDQHAKDSISQGKFMDSMMSMNKDILATDLSNLIEQVKNTQELLTSTTNTVGQDSSEESDEAVEERIKSIDARIKRLKKLANKQKSDLEEQTKDINAFVDKRVQENYGKDSLTVSDLLKGAKGQNYLTTSVDAYKKSMDQLIVTALNQLPAIDSGSVQSLAGQMTALDDNAASALSSFDSKQAANYQGQFTPSNLANDLSSLKADLDKHSSSSTDADAKAASDSDTAKVSVESSSSDLVIDSWSYNGTTYNTLSEVPVKLSDSASFTFNYHYTTTQAQADNGAASEPSEPATSSEASSEAPATTNTTNTTSSQTNGSITLKIDGKSVASTTVDKDAYRKAAVAYARKVQEINDAYANAQRLLSNYFTSDGTDLTTAFFNQPATDLVKDVMKDMITSHLTAYSSVDESNKSLLQEISELESLKGTLSKQLTDLESSNKGVQTDLSQQLEALQKLKEQAQSLNDNQGQSTSAMEATDNSLGDLSSGLASLQSSTAKLKATSDANLTEAEQVKSMFSSFDDNVKTAQDSSAKLSKDAQSLMNDFDKELKDSGDFVGSFVKVLNNAYSNGVANDVLLDFLSNPVAEKSSSVKATVNVYRPFTWILLLEIVSLFAAYLFANYNMTKRVKDRFGVNRFKGTDLLNVALLSLIAVVIGLVVGGLSSSKLSVESEFVPSWVLLVTLFSLILTHGQYFLIKNFKALGMGLSLFMIISFVYLSSAVGTTAALSGLPAILKRFNVLSILEGRLSTYFANQGASLALIGMTLIASLVLMVANIFVTIDWKQSWQLAKRAE